MRRLTTRCQMRTVCFLLLAWYFSITVPLSIQISCRALVTGLNTRLGITVCGVRLYSTRTTERMRLASCRCGVRMLTGTMLSTSPCVSGRRQGGGRGLIARGCTTLCARFSCNGRENQTISVLLSNGPRLPRLVHPWQESGLRAQVADAE